MTRLALIQTQQAVCRAQVCSGSKWGCGIPRKGLSLHCMTWQALIQTQHAVCCARICSGSKVRLCGSIVRTITTLYDLTSINTDPAGSVLGPGMFRFKVRLCNSTIRTVTILYDATSGNKDSGCSVVGPGLFRFKVRMCRATVCHLPTGTPPVSWQDGGPRYSVECDVKLITHFCEITEAWCQTNNSLHIHHIHPTLQNYPYQRLQILKLNARFTTKSVNWSDSPPNPSRVKPITYQIDTCRFLVSRSALIA